MPLVILKAQWIISSKIKLGASLMIASMPVNNNEKRQSIFSRSRKGNNFERSKLLSPKDEKKNENLDQPQLSSSDSMINRIINALLLVLIGTCITSTCYVWSLLLWLDNQQVSLVYRWVVGCWFPEWLSPAAARAERSCLVLRSCVWSPPSGSSLKWI